MCAAHICVLKQVVWPQTAGAGDAPPMYHESGIGVRHLS